jgi:hypothetical protein
MAGDKPSSIKDPSNKWEKTFPHKTFVDLLKATERMLARGTNSDKKGIWIEGAYGTGKSRVAWTLKNLLDCSDNALKAYFDEYPALQAEPDLRDKLLGHKQGKIITAYRYASGGIDSDRALIMAVYESVTRHFVTQVSSTKVRTRCVAAWLYGFRMTRTKHSLTRLLLCLSTEGWQLCGKISR